MVDKAIRFEFAKYDFNPDHKSFGFYYKTELADGTNLTFKETLTLPEEISLSVIYEKWNMIKPVLESLLLIIGISYWKLHISKAIHINSFRLTRKQAQFWEIMYSKGLSEFYYRNKVNLRTGITFPSRIESETSPNCRINNTQKRVLTGIGGGKDSLVSVELLKMDKNIDQAGFQVISDNQVSDAGVIADLTGIPVLKVIRRIDRKLKTLNDVYKGHVPISALYGFVGVLLAVLEGRDYVIVSNEKSANVGNTIVDGCVVNHQWSKSEEFEIRLREYIYSYISVDITYVSLLRPFHELLITKLFTAYPVYFSAFSSCNRNFSIQDAQSKSSHHLSWCGKCPKCAFTFIMLSAFLKKDLVVKIFGRNLLDDASLIPLYKQLLGIEGIKPFDCVGTAEETQLAFYMTCKKNEFKDTPVMGMFLRDSLKEIRYVTDMCLDLCKVDSYSESEPISDFGQILAEAEKMILDISCAFKDKHIL